MQFKSVSYICSKCKTVWGILVDRETEELIDHKDGLCPDCGTAGAKTISAPTVMRASYPDGTRRTGFAELREISKLRKEMLNKPVKDRKELKKAIKEVEKS